MLNLPVIIIPLRNYLYGHTSFGMEVIKFTTSFNWIFEKKKFCQCEFHFCRHEIDYTFFVSAFFCRHEIIWVRKTGSSTSRRCWGAIIHYIFNSVPLCEPQKNMLVGKTFHRLTAYAQIVKMLNCYAQESTNAVKVWKSQLNANIWLKDGI